MLPVFLLALHVTVTVTVTDGIAVKEYQSVQERGDAAQRIGVHSQDGERICSLMHLVLFCPKEKKRWPFSGSNA